MPPPFANPWQALLATEAGAGVATVLGYRVLQKNGRPWLLLPREARLAQQALALYPAQSVKARFAKTALRFCLSLGFVPGAERLDLRVETNAPFVQFLQKTVGASVFPRCASLAGNPATPGQRHILLLFDESGSAKWVVKAGVGGRAVELIGAEVKALRTLAGVPGVPPLRGEFETDSLRAFALDFCPGESPVPAAKLALLDLLTAWIQPQRTIPARQLPALIRLQEFVVRKPELAMLLEALAAVAVHPVIMHGDFTPWNVKVAARDGSWLVLDWERGETDGVPGWDWFHFVIQTELLVKRRAPEAIAQKLRKLMGSPLFQRYAAATKIVGHEQALLCAYLAYFTQVIRPSEGCDAAEELLRYIMR